MDVTGTIKLIKEEQQISASFKKRELVITTDEQYPQILMIEFVQDRTSLLDAFKPGDTVKVDINLRGREWTNPQGEVRYFNSITGWRIENVMVQPQVQPASPTPGAAAPLPDAIQGEDDLPF